MVQASNPDLKSHLTAGSSNPDFQSSSASFLSPASRDAVDMTAAHLSTQLCCADNMNMCSSSTHQRSQGNNLHQPTSASLAGCDFLLVAVLLLFDGV
jgi:hypothetical protein